METACLPVVNTALSGSKRSRHFVTTRVGSSKTRNKCFFLRENHGHFGCGWIVNASMRSCNFMLGKDPKKPVTNRMARIYLLSPSERNHIDCIHLDILYPREALPVENTMILVLSLRHWLKMKIHQCKTLIAVNEASAHVLSTGEMCWNMWMFNRGDFSIVSKQTCSWLNEFVR